MIEKNNNYDSELYDKLSITELLTIKPENIDEWNDKYDKYIHSEWDRIFDQKYSAYNKENLDKIILLITHKEFMHPFWKELSGESIPRNSDEFNNKLSIDGYNLQNLMSKRLNEITDCVNNFEYFGDFSGIDLRGAYMWHFKLDGAIFNNSIMQGVIIRGASLINANFGNADLSRASFENAKCQSADFTGSNLNGAYFKFAVVDGLTLFYDIICDKYTDFSGVGLSGCRILPDIKRKLESNIRRIYWIKWYKKEKIYNLITRMKVSNVSNESLHKKGRLNCIKLILSGIDEVFINLPVKFFWMVSSYGRSTISLILWFLACNSIWFIIYSLILLIEPNLFSGTGSFVHGNFTIDNIINMLIQSNMVGFYPDIIGNSGNLWWSLCSLLHIVINYIFLAALVTRLSTLFQDLSP